MYTKNDKYNLCIQRMTNAEVPQHSKSTELFWYIPNPAISLFMLIYAKDKHNYNTYLSKTYPFRYSFNKNKYVYMGKTLLIKNIALEIGTI